MRVEENGRLRLSASDVANFLACGHPTRLDLLHARGGLDPPQAFDSGFEDLVRRGYLPLGRYLHQTPAG